MTHGPWLRPVVGDTEWRRRAACKGVDAALFFPSDDEPKEPAKAICRRCPVKAECLEFAIANREDEGIWGGVGEKERARIRRARARGKTGSERTCKRCGGEFPPSGFPEHRPGEPRPYCWDCWRAIGQESRRYQCKRCRRRLGPDDFTEAAGKTCNDCWGAIRRELGIGAERAS